MHRVAINFEIDMEQDINISNEVIKDEPTSEERELGLWLSGDFPQRKSSC